jgi:acetylornithine deacetylase/succinyl-diaminopimelate desuccinylase-like protein
MKNSHPDITHQAAQWLSEYLKINTTNPPGDEEPAAQFLISLLKEWDIPAAFYPTAPNRGNVLAVLKAENPIAGPILLQHHMDVVPADPASWSQPPFGGTQAEGYIYGRGAIDMKSFGIMALAAMIQIRQKNTPRKRDILFLAAADEEIGGDFGTGWMVENCWKDLQPEFVWDEGAFGLRGLFGPRPTFFVAVAEKQTVWTRMVAAGEPGLASVPRDNNPVTILTRALRKLEEHLFQPRLTEIPQEMFRRIGLSLSFPQSFLLQNLKNPLIWRIARKSLTTTPLINAMLRNLVTPTQLKGSDKENVIPETAEATLDIRLLPGENPQAFVRKMEKIVNDDRIHFILPETIHPSSVSDYGSDFFKALEETIISEVPEALVVPILTPGGTDSLFYRQRGVNAYGLVPILIDNDEVERMHGIDERISLDNLALGIRVMTGVLENTCLT